MIIGAIDVGSNSVKLLIGAAVGGRVRAITSKSAVTRLGGGVDRTGRIARSAQDRTIAVLRQFRRICGQFKVERRVAVGTEALRLARNGGSFTKLCELKTGIPLRILTAREEARLSFLGATSGRREKRLAAIDIGGGSTEIMFGKPGNLQGAMSLALGAVRLTELHLKSDPPQLAERMALFQRVHEELDRLPRKFRRATGRGTTLLGIGGTCVNVARMVRPAGSPEGRIVPFHTLEEVTERIAELPLTRRKRVPGIDPDRADIILAGSRILAETLRVLEIRSFTATVHGLRRGMILHESDRGAGSL
jgi:exopolyphosphatase/guanosine-5'-triphosphate,3'-diphosphate pyrophosphatase